MSPPDKSSSAFDTIYFFKHYGIAPQIVIFVKAISMPNVSCNPLLGLT